MGTGPARHGQTYCSKNNPRAGLKKGKPVLIVLPSSPGDVSGVLGPWLVNHVPQNRNMIRFLLPKADQPEIYADRSLLITARCALLAREWQQTEASVPRLAKAIRSCTVNRSQESLRPLRSFGNVELSVAFCVHLPC